MTDQVTKKTGPTKAWYLLVEWFRANLEIFLIAFVLAMTIRCFCIDGFKIPSGSMEPTLMGNPSSGDRIIADKFSVFFTPVKRFDVILFKYPLDLTKNFIKRTIGLPNEEIKTKDGDIYYKPKREIKFKLARKPLSIQESIWIPVWHWRPDFKHIDKKWILPKEYKIEDDKLCLYPDVSYNSESKLKLRYKIEDYYDGKGKGISSDVPDIKLSFKCRFKDDKGIIETTIDTLFGKFTYCVSPSAENYLAQNNNKIPTVQIKEKPEKEKEHLVEFIHYDAILYIKLDGKIIAEYDYEDKKDSEAWRIEYPQILITAKKSQVKLWDVNIYRDIYYDLKNYGESVSIENDKYFVIGDNVRNSRDSRDWNIRSIYLKDGSVIHFDADYYSYNEYENYHEIYRGDDLKGGDIWGNTYKIPDDKVEYVSDSKPSPFVDIKNIFGRALFVYWPLRNLKIIR